MTLKVDDIVMKKEELSGSQATQQRLSAYEALADRIGRETIESERFAYFEAPTTRQKAPWERGDDDSDFLVHVPFLHQIIEDQRTVLGAMRSHRVPLPEPGDENAQRYADKLERGVSHMWRTWRMPVFLSEVAWYATCFGTGIGVLKWDKKNKFPMPAVHSPENFLAQADPDDPTRVQVGIFVKPTLGKMLKFQYRDIKGIEELEDDEEYDVIDYYDDEMRYRVIEGVEVFIIEAKNPLDHTPIYMFRSIAIPGSLFGGSNLTKAIPVQDEIDRLYSRQAEYLDAVMNAPTFIKDPDDVPANFTWNKDAVVTMGPQGAIGKAPIASIDPRVFEYRLEDMKHNLDNAMDFSNLSRGEYHTQVSGKGVVALKSGTEQRMMMRLQTFDSEIERMTEDGLLLWQKAGGKATKGIYGKVQGSMFSDQFNPKVDINKDWVHVYVYLDSAAYIDRQAAQVTNLQKLRGQPQAMSVRRFLELDPDCEDVEAEVMRIEGEQQRFIQMQNEAQMAQQQMMQPPTQGAGEQAYAAERGGAIEGAPPGGPGAGPAPQPGAPGAPPGAEPGVEGEDDVLASVADLFRGAKKVRGEVWLVGEYLEGGITPDEFADGFIDVFVSDPLDKATLLNFLRATELAGAVEQQRLVFHEDHAFLMAHPRLNVSPGSQGYDLEGGEEEQMPEEELPMGMEPEEAGTVPPGMEQMMGAMGGGMPPGPEGVM